MMCFAWSRSSLLDRERKKAVRRQSLKTVDLPGYEPVPGQGVTCAYTAHFDTKKGLLSQKNDRFMSK